MAIVVEAIAVVVRNVVLERQFPGGVAAFQSSAPNASYLSDGKITSIAFNVMDDAKRYADALKREGLNATDLAIVHRSLGIVSECAWLDIDLRTLTDEDARRVAATIAWPKDEEPGLLFARPGWQALQMVSDEDLQQNYEPVRVERRDGEPGVVVVYRHRPSGQMLQIWRSAISASEDWHLRYFELQTDVQRLLTAPISKTRDRMVTSCFDRASELVTSSNGQHAGALHLHGIAARFLRKWDLAEQSFRKVTERCPDFLAGWLELTWALGALDRFEDAEASARRAIEVDPDSVAALGNLASVLQQRGHADKALPVITRAIALDPSNTKNQLILQRVRDACRPAPQEPETDVPWYKRLFR